VNGCGETISHAGERAPFSGLDELRCERLVHLSELQMSNQQTTPPSAPTPDAPAAVKISGCACENGANQKDSLHRN
jgi:hypothetical protein